MDTQQLTDGLVIITSLYIAYRITVHGMPKPKKRGRHAK